MKEHVEVLQGMLCDWHYEEEEAALRVAIDLMNAAEPGTTFERAWAATGRQYGEDALEQVKLGWEMGRASLMNAAEPMDEVAEREHYTHAWYTSRVESVVDFLMRERAAARAEVVQSLTHQLSAARAEHRAVIRTMSENEGKLHADIARLETIIAAKSETYDKLQCARLDARGDVGVLQTKLQAAQAKIAELTRQRGEAWNSSEDRLRKLLDAQAKIERLKRQERFWGEAADLTQIKLSNLRTSAESYWHGRLTDGEFETAIEASK